MFRQAIDIPGIGNARELGGYAIGEQHVREGVLLRTAGLASASPEALTRLSEAYRVQTIVDLRMSFESKLAPDPVVAGARNVHLPVIEIEDYPLPEGFDASDVDKFLDPSMDRMKLFELAYGFGMLGPEIYVDFLLRERGKGAYAAFFQELLALDEGRAVLWHCTDGKDRTGCAAVLTLCALGASRGTVLADYLLTNEYNAHIVEAVRRKVAGVSMPDEKREALLFMCGGVIEGYMQHALDVLDERYGSVEGYLAEELGVGAAERAELRAKFLV